MTKFGKAITLETLDSFHPIKFIVIECDTKKAADEELKQWLKDYPEILKIENNKKIIEMALNGK